MKRLFVAFLGILTLPQLSLSQEVCNGVRCPPTQFCSNGLFCEDKMPLRSPCTGLGQCLVQYSDCFEDSCRCDASYWTEGPGDASCILKCERGCSLITYCHTLLGGCVPRVAQGSPCDPDEASPDQCRADNAICDNGMCTCGPDFISEGSSCLPKCPTRPCREGVEFCDATSGKCEPKKNLGQTCADSEECLLPNSICSASNVCGCAPGFVNYFNTACVPECGLNDDCATNQYCSTSVKYCVKKAGLGETCDTETPSTGQCTDPNASCDGVCTCTSPAYGEDAGVCVQTCQNHAECGAISDFFCDSATSFCRPRRALGESCPGPEGNMDQCFNSTTAVCNSNNLCSCNADHYQNGASCKTKCSVANDCNSATEFCNPDSGRCSRKIELNGICNPDHSGNCRASNSECQPTDRRCSCTSQFVESSGSCVAKCSGSNPCDSSSGLFCHLDEGKCYPRRGLGDACPMQDEGQDNERPCRDSYAACLDDTCSCKATHVELNSACVATCTEEDNSACNSDTEFCDHEGTPNICHRKVGLHSHCAYPDACATSNAACIDNTCTCSPDFYDYAGHFCIQKCSVAPESCSTAQYCDGGSGQCKVKKGLGDVCANTEECRPTDSICEGTCTCPASHHNDFTICTLKCTTTSGCDASSHYCDMRIERCQQKSPFGSQCTLEANKDQCLGKLTFCLRDDATRLRCQCAPNAEAEGDGCECVPSHVESGNGLQCLKSAEKVGDACEESQQCNPLSSEGGSTACNGGACLCTGNYVENGNDDKCLKKAEKVGDTCEEAVQCQVLSPELNAYACNGTCHCTSSYVGSGDLSKCLKSAEKIGDQCEEPQQCDLLSSEAGSTACSGGICGCTANYLENGNNNKCLKKATALRDPCEEHPQCVHLGNYEGNQAAAECQALKCDCTTSSKEAEGRCFALKKIDSSCESDKDCSNGGIEGSVTCSEGKTCACASGEVANADKTKCSKAGGSEDSSASTFGTVSILIFVSILVNLWV